MPYMITGSWGDTKLMCGNHEKPVEMVIQQGPHSLFYACPKYFGENREAGEHICANRLNLVEFDKMLDHINALLCEEAAVNNAICLTNYSWKSRGVEYKILSHTSSGIVVQCLNRKALIEIKR